MAYRDEEDGLRVRVTELEQELSAARETIARIQGDRGAEPAAEEKVGRLLGVPWRLERERELPFEITDEGYEAIAELIKKRLPQLGEVSMVGRTLTYAFRGHEIVRLTRVADGRSCVKIHGDHRGHGGLFFMGLIFGGFFGLVPCVAIAKAFALTPASLAVLVPVWVLACFFALRKLVGLGVMKERKKLIGALESIAELAAQHKAPARARIAAPPDPETEEAETAEVQEAEAVVRQMRTS